MKNKLQLNVDDLDKYTVEELKQQVDQAIGQVSACFYIFSKACNNKFPFTACKSIEDERTVGYAVKDTSSRLGALH